MAYWCAAQLQASRENLALHMLQEIEGFTVYAPRLRQRRRQHGRWIETLPLLFVTYIFITIEREFYRARWCPGVIRLVMDGLQPARVPNEVINELRQREHRGAIELPKPPGLQRGDRVKVLSGPFTGHLGLYAGMRPHARVEVLLAILGSQQRVTLPRGGVALVPNSGGS
jgi:transcriptional antiterminator RfaH